MWVSHLEGLVAEKGALLVGVDCSRRLTSTRMQAGCWPGGGEGSGDEQAGPGRAESKLVWNGKETEVERVGWAKQNKIWVKARDFRKITYLSGQPSTSLPHLLV